jgi:protein-disulfide isomerase
MHAWMTATDPNVMALEYSSRLRRAVCCIGIGVAGLWMSLSTLGAEQAANKPAVPSVQQAITSAQAEEILTELRKIRQLLEKNSAASQPAAVPVPEKVSVAVRDSNALGRDDAPLTMIEFADFQCPFCRRFHTDTFDEIRKNFIDTGKLRYISRDLPLPMHDHAPQAARAARCAGDQHHFWELRHLLILNQDKLGSDDLLTYARQLNLDVPVFTTCIDSRRYDAAVQQDATDAAEVGVVGTPTFIIGRTFQKGRFEGIKIVGVQPYFIYEAKIREFLADQKLAAQAQGRDPIHQQAQGIPRAVR